jgi:hypothetical protein
VFLMNWQSEDSFDGHISGCYRRARSSERLRLFGPARRNDLAAKL